jgi:hypothetical protein
MARRKSSLAMAGPNASIARDLVVMRYYFLGEDTMNCNLAGTVMLLLLISSGVNHEKPMDPDKVLEPPAFWTALANDGKVETWRRALSVYLLFERHVKRGGTLGELAELINKPKWIDEDDVQVVTKGGIMPLKRTPGDTIFCVVVFRDDAVETSSKQFALYVNVSGKMDKKTFLSIILKRDKSDNEKQTIKDWAFTPNWDTYVKSIRP